MAPEQARSRGEGVGPAADIYALGSILYEMLTGRPPFDSPTPAETLAALLNEEPVSPSRLRPRVPRDLATICLRCLEKTPRRRYASALELADDLQSFLAGKPIHARPIGPLERAYRWCRRRPLAAGLLALCGILAISFLVTVLIYQHKLRQANEEQRQQIIQLHIIIGTAELEDEDLLAAMVRFTQALYLEGEGTERAVKLRTRIATILRQSPHLNRLIALEERALCVRSDAEKEWVATVSQDNLVIVWDVLKGQSTGASVKLDFSPVDGALSPDGRRLATVSAAGLAQIWDLSTGTATTLPLSETGPVKHLSFHPDSTILITRADGPTIRFWDEMGRQTDLSKELSGKDLAFTTLSEDGRWYLTVNGTHEAQVWDVKTGKPTAPPLKLETNVHRAAISLEGRRLALLDSDEVLTIWDLPAAQSLRIPLRAHGGVKDLVFRPGGEQILTVSEDREAQEWQAQTGQPLAEWSGCEPTAGSTHFSPDGRFVITCAGVAPMQVREAATGKAVSPPLRHDGELASAEFRADLQQLVTVSKGGTICSWTLPKLPQPTQAPSTEEPDTRPEVKRDGLPRSIALKNGVTVQVKKAATDSTLRPPGPVDRTVEQAVFSPDGLLVAVAENANTIRVWDAVSGEPRSPPLKHRRSVLCAAFSPDGHRLLTATEGTARLWDALSGEALAPPLHHNRPIQRVGFRADGNSALVFHEGKTVTTWDLTPDERQAQELLDWAHLLACEDLDAKQQTRPLEAEPLRLTWEKTHRPN
jgi:WD40 repeat protein